MNMTPTGYYWGAQQPAAGAKDAGGSSSIPSPRREEQKCHPAAATRGCSSQNGAVLAEGQSAAYQHFAANGGWSQSKILFKSLVLLWIQIDMKLIDEFVPPRPSASKSHSCRRMGPKLTAGCPTTGRPHSCFRQSCRTAERRWMRRRGPSKVWRANCASLRLGSGGPPPPRKTLTHSERL